MLSAIETYDAARLAVEAAEKDVEEISKNLSQLAQDLMGDPGKLLRGKINYPVDDGPRVLDDDDIADQLRVEFLPDQEIIRAEVVRLRDARAEKDRAYAALSPVEAQYVGLAEGRAEAKAGWGER